MMVAMVIIITDRDYDDIECTGKLIIELTIN